MALWGALARVNSISLLALLGGDAKPVSAYGAVGYDGEVESAKVAEDWVQRGFTGVKAKIGYPTLAQDLAVIHAIPNAVGPEIGLSGVQNDVEVDAVLTGSEHHALPLLFKPYNRIIPEAVLRSRVVRAPVSRHIPADPVAVAGLSEEVIPGHWSLRGTNVSLRGECGTPLNRLLREPTDARLGHWS